MCTCCTNCNIFFKDSNIEYQKVIPTFQKTTHKYLSILHNSTQKMEATSTNKEIPTSTELNDQIKPTSISNEENATNISTLPDAAPSTTSSSEVSISPAPTTVLIEPKKPKAPLSGYFLFLAKYRPIVKAANPTVSIGELGKLLGKKWSTLEEIEKSGFQTTAAEAKAKYQPCLVQWKLDMEEFIKKGGVPATSMSSGDYRDCVLPLARVKKIMKRDPDVANMSKEALFLMTKCTDIFIEHLGEAAIRQAYGQKRKGVRLEDINSAIRATSSARFLEADFPITGPSNHKRQKITTEGTEGDTASKSSLGPMDSFFKKKVVAEAAPESDARQKDSTKK